MAQQLQKKFLGNDQVDGDKIKLEQGQSIRAVDSSDAVVDLIKLGTSDEILVNGDEVSLKADLDQEISDRAAGDASTLSSANAYADQKIADLVDSAPELLDTLNELAAALGDDPNFVTTVTNMIADVQSEVDAVEVDVSDLVTLSGVSVNSQHLGEFDGSTIPNSQTIKQALQALETAVESVSGGGSSTQTELDDTQVGAGLESDGSYVAPVGSNYLGSATSLKDADSKLDVEIKSVSDDLAQEISDRIADVDAEESRAIAAEGVLQSNIDTVASDLTQEISDRIADVDAEESRALAAEGVLQSNIDTVASDLTQEISDRQADVDAEEARAIAAEGVLQSNIDTVSGDIAQEIIDRAADVDAEESRAIAAEAALQSEIDAVESDLAQEISDRIADVDAEESARIAADDALDARIDVLESIVWFKESFSISNNQTSVTLSHIPESNSMSAFVDRLAIHEGASEDYEISGTTMTFLNDLVSPGQSQLGAGDTVYVKYQYKV